VTVIRSSLPFPLLVLALAGVLAACGDAAERDARRAGEPAVASSEVAQQYAPALDVDLERMTRMESGLHIEDVEEGAGEEAEPGRVVVVHYTGWLPDGTQFDTSRQPDRGPFDFALGAGHVIEGWDQGVQGMRVGGKRRLVIPPSMAYGTSGAGGVIPPNATLVFDVELLEVR
jgi:FKBP-type peptidyl-prolyl cis-trans isomerase FkpA